MNGDDLFPESLFQEERGLFYHFLTMSKSRMEIMEEMFRDEPELFLQEVSDHEGTFVKNEWTGRGLMSYRLFFPVCPDDWILRKECSKAIN